MYIARERLYVNRDYSKLVPEGSPEAAFVLATAGKAIPEALARRLGLLDPKPTPVPAPSPPTKAAGKAAADKDEPADDSPTRRHPLPKADKS